MKRPYLILLFLLALTGPVSSFAAQSSDRPASKETRTLMLAQSETTVMKIRLTVAGRTLTAALDDNPTARDFVSLLPLTIVLEDYAGTEKIAYLSRKLTTEGAPAGVDPSVGDITYYAPWGNLALFYRDFGYAKGLIKIGSIDDGIDIFSVPGSIEVTIEAR